MATVVLEGINKVYDNCYDTIHDLDLSIADKEFLALVGPSGCGKSTPTVTLSRLARTRSLCRRSR